MKRTVLIALWILSATLICSAQTTFYYPHLANGNLGGNLWKTTILLSNPSSTAAASGTITVNRENANTNAAGSIFTTIQFIDQDFLPAGSGGTITFSIPPGQTRKYTSTGSGGYAGGSAKVDVTAGSVKGTAIFSEFDSSGTRLIAEAGVPAAEALPNQAIFVDTQGGFNIGVAYANPGPAAANVTLSLLDSAAVSVATTTVILGPGNHSAAFTSQIFVGSPQLVGTMQLRSTGAPLSAIALRFDPSFSVFTTLPPFSLASLISPAIDWFEQRQLFKPLASVARLLGAFHLRMG